MWSLLYQAEVHVGPSAGASILNNATQKALFAATFDGAEEKKWYLKDHSL